MERREYAVGDVVRMKKKHPCGSDRWQVLRTGADFRMQCTGCGRQMMMPRPMVEKNTREIQAVQEGTYSHSPRCAR